jgi:hypothetical protein
MSLPSGLIFFLDFTFSSNLGASNSQTGRTGNLVDKSIYGTDQVGSEIINGVDLIESTNKSGFSGPGRDGQTGYAYASPTGSNAGTVANAAGSMQARTFMLDGAVSDADKKKILYDADILSITDSSYGVLVLDIAEAEHDSALGDADYDNLSAFELLPLRSGQSGFALANTFVTAIANFGGITSGSLATNNVAQVRRLTKNVGAGDSMLTAEAAAVRYVIVGDSTVVSSA